MSKCVAVMCCMALMGIVLLCGHGESHVLVEEMMWLLNGSRMEGRDMCCMMCLQQWALCQQHILINRTNTRK